MPLQNRVWPDGELVSHPCRGLLMGNRGGRLHDPATKTIRRWQTSRRWICCVLSFKNRRREVMGKGYTELFFLDEVTALAAGHRPCFECRRAEAQAYARAAARHLGLEAAPGADWMDLQLAPERGPRWQGKPADGAALRTLPDGTMLTDGAGFLALKSGRLLRWSPDGYAATNLPDGLQVITPALSLAALSGGYQPIWYHTS
ncbi:Uncharacterised protein [Pannonibacter phragmitetus]|uniref:Uncharacterized protein n=1 Tax=Pannonibacter phragmitetus TaxID=121719 RepID=A0A378ZRR1_9HYPH|nr:hypothetical protein [Pannonibacter phragmitetus]SUA99827.1 Uncharacterised protein [Pannonibacter phragmitetus]